MGKKKAAEACRWAMHRARTKSLDKWDLLRLLYDFKGEIEAKYKVAIEDVAEWMISRTADEYKDLMDRTDRCDPGASPPGRANL